VAQGRVGAEGCQANKHRSNVEDGAVDLHSVTDNNETSLASLIQRVGERPQTCICNIHSSYDA
jgi:hypothetical protein